MANDTLRSNVIALRNYYGETQEELALNIGANRSTISNFESGKRGLKNDTIKRIASHYRVTVDQLQMIDYAVLLSGAPQHTEKNYREYVNMTEKILPIVSSEEALANESFKKTYMKHSTIFKMLSVPFCNWMEIGQNIGQCIDAYDKLGDEIIEAEINGLGLVFLIWNGSSMNIDLETLHEFTKGRINENDLIKNGVLRNVDHDEQEDVTQFRDELLNLEDDIISSIRRIRSNEKYRELGDYYTALRYIVGLVKSTDLTNDMLNVVGLEMMYVLLQFQNPYALQFFSISNNKEL